MIRLADREPAALGRRLPPHGPALRKLELRGLHAARRMA